jgi:hypothetical protein
VLALIDLPPNADVKSGRTDRGAAFAVLHMPQFPVTITATPLDDSIGEPRSLIIHDPNAQVLIVNVNALEYMAGLPAQDDDHKYLVCEIFRSHSSDSESTQPLSPFAAFAAMADALPHDGIDLSDVHNPQMQQAARRNMYDFLDTLAGGCSASQWP